MSFAEKLPDMKQFRTKSANPLRAGPCGNAVHAPISSKQKQPRETGPVKNQGMKMSSDSLNVVRCAASCGRDRIPVFALAAVAPCDPVEAEFEAAFAAEPVFAAGPADAGSSDRGRW